MRDCDVVVLSRYPEIFEGFRECVDRDAPELSKTVLWDAATKHFPDLREPWYSTRTAFPFQMARNANIAWQSAPYEKDVLYCGDDSRIIEPDTISRLQALAYSDPEIGILSPRIAGNCAVGPAESVTVPLQFVQYVGFVFVYIKRELIEKVGYLDERFEGYGVEDIDYCVRARRAGFKIGIAKDITVKHGVNGHSYGSTFIKVRGEEQMGKDDRANWKRFAEKWGLENDYAKIFEFIAHPDRC